ncbi:MAG TPA: HemK/PrmC family methyltransferase, partial [Pyrinomonadaceae bacterium]
MSEQSTATTIADALVRATFTLRRAGVAEARREAASLLAHALGRDRTFLITHADESLSDADFRGFQQLVARRAAGEPFQYISGRQEFYGLDFEVTPDVLIPRPETELLVEVALEHLKATAAPVLCDVGTGSGCIAVTLLHEFREA